MAFDGIVTKAIASELQQLSGARIDKIFQPNSNNIILGFYLNGKNYALNISTNSSNYRIHLTTHPKPNPKIAPNFCMVLRKHLIGLHIKNVITPSIRPTVPKITPSVNAFHSGNRAIHIPSANKTPLIVPNIIATKLLFSFQILLSLNQQLSF